MRTVLATADLLNVEVDFLIHFRDWEKPGSATDGQESCSEKNRLEESGAIDD